MAGVLILASAAGCTSADGQSASTTTSAVGSEGAPAAGSGEGVSPPSAAADGETPVPDDAAAAEAADGATDPAATQDGTATDGESAPLDDGAGLGAAAPMGGSGDLGDLGSTDGLTMPNVVGQSVADARGVLSGIEVAYTDLDGDPVAGGDQQQVCQQSPDADTDATGQNIVLAVADTC